jgi:glycosyltransferase involved in cell wall biosynthesis
MVSSHGDDPSAGGVEKLLAELSQRLVAGGTDVAYLQAFPSRGPVADIERTVLHEGDWREDQVRRVRNHVDDLLSLPGRTLEEAIRRYRPDVVHTHSLPGITTAVWEASRRLGVPVVHSLHDYYLLCPRASLTRRDASPCRPSPLLCGVRTRRLLRWSSAVSQVIGVSRYVLDLHALLFSNAQLHVLRHPLAAADVGEVRPPRRPPAVLGYIGSLDRIKGVHLLLEAAPRLARLGIGLRLAGRGRLDDEVKAGVRQHENVEWDGAVLGEQKRRYLEACDLGAVPSVWAEAGGPTFTMIEWLAAGRPALVSTRGGLVEVVGRNPGWIPIEPTVDSIVDAVADLLDPARWQAVLSSLGPVGSGREVEDWVERHEAIYRSLTS